MSKKFSAKYPTDEGNVAVALPPEPSTPEVKPKPKRVLVQLSPEKQTGGRELQKRWDERADFKARYSHDAAKAAFKAQRDPGFSGVPRTQESFEQEYSVRRDNYNLNNTARLATETADFVRPIWLEYYDDNARRIDVAEEALEPVAQSFDDTVPEQIGRWRLRNEEKRKDAATFKSATGGPWSLLRGFADLSFLD